MSQGSINYASNYVPIPTPVPTPSPTLFPTPPSSGKVVAMWFQDISGPTLAANAATLKAHGVTHVLWTLGTWREGETPNYEYWQSGFAQGITALHNQGIKAIALIMNTWPGAPADVNVDNSAYNTARINSAVSIVQQYGFDGFADVLEQWSGSEANFISYNNQLNIAMHNIGKEFFFVNMCWEGMGWSISNVYGNIVADYVVPEFYGDPDCTLEWFTPFFHTLMVSSKSPIVVGTTVQALPDGCRYTLAEEFAWIEDELNSYPNERSKYAGISVFGGTHQGQPNPFFMSATDWAMLDAYLATW